MIWRRNKKGDVPKGAHSSSDTFYAKSESIREQLLTRFGLDIGEIQILLEVIDAHTRTCWCADFIQVAKLQAMVVSRNGAVQKKFSTETVFVPAQLLPSTSPRTDARFVPRELLFPINESYNY